MAAPRKGTVAVGFSLEGDGVKYAELVAIGGGRYRVGRWGMRGFGSPPDEVEGAVLETPIEPPGPGGPLLQPWTAGVLRKLRKFPFYASLSDGDVLMKFITLPELTTSEVARMVELRHREYLPMPNKEIVYDFSLTRFVPLAEEGEDAGEEGAGERSRVEEAELRVTVAGLERAIYLGYREAMGQEGVLLRSLETNQAAITRGGNFLLGQANPGTYALLYLSDNYSMINFVVDGGLYYSRMLEQGLRTLTPDETGRRRAERLLREIYRSVDKFVAESFEKLFGRLAKEGRISPELDIATLAKVFTVIGDGLFLRRAVDPDFDPKKVVPAVVNLVGKLMNVNPARLEAAADKAFELEPR